MRELADFYIEESWDEFPIDRFFWKYAVFMFADTGGLIFLQKNDNLVWLRAFRGLKSRKSYVILEKFVNFFTQNERKKNEIVTFFCRHARSTGQLYDRLQHHLRTR